MTSCLQKIMDSFIYATDLQCFGRDLIEFANHVYNEKNRTSIIKHFYEQMRQWSFSDYIFSDFFKKGSSKFYICDNQNAIRLYVGLMMPPKKSTVKTINEIKKYGEYIQSNFVSPVGDCISAEILENILQYFEKHYSLFSKVFLNKKIAFIRIPNSHKICNSECLTLINNNEIINHFFLYHMKEKNVISPEDVLFHELGHAIHAQRFGDVGKVPDEIIDKLQSLCFPDLKQLDAEELCEIFADVLGLGLMYETPFEDVTAYKKIHPSDKKEFKNLVVKLINSET